VRLRLAAVLTATALSLIAIVWGMDIGRSVEAVLAYDLAWIMPMVLVLTVVLVIRTWRFQLLLDHTLAFRAMFPIVVVSFLAVSVMPLRMGELVRPYLLAEKHDVPFGTAMAAVVLSRLFDVVALLVLIAATGWLVDLPELVAVGEIDLLAVGQRTLAMSATVGFAGVVVLGVAGGRVVPLVGRIVGAVSPRFSETVVGLLEGFVDGLRVLASNPGRAALAALSTVAIWSGMVGTVFLAMNGMGGIAATFEAALLNWTSAIIGTVLFPTPGYLGAFEAPSVVSLMVLGAEREVATAFSLGLHAILLGHTAVLGVALMAVEGWSLATLVRASRAGRT